MYNAYIYIKFSKNKKISLIEWYYHNSHQIENKELICNMKYLYLYEEFSGVTK